MTDQTFTSVWDAIEATPDAAENMKLRSRLMMAITETIHANGWTQKTAADHLGVTQPRISDLTRGRIDLFSLDTLVSMATAVGLHIELTVSRAA